MAGGETLLRVEHLSMRFGGLMAVGDLSFDVRRGDITALIGPNGAGKTTVFNCITGFYKPTSGRIAMTPEGAIDTTALDALTRSGARGANGLYLLERMPDHEIAREARVARTFQNIRLFAGMTALENLIVAQHKPLMRASGFSIAGLIGAPSYRAAEAAAKDKARMWLDRIGLTARADDPAKPRYAGDARPAHRVQGIEAVPETRRLGPATTSGSGPGRRPSGDRRPRSGVSIRARCPSGIYRAHCLV